MYVTQPRIFINYSRTDSAFVDQLEADLQQNGYNTWVDRRKLEGGQSWRVFRDFDDACLIEHRCGERTAEERDLIEQAG